MADKKQKQHEEVDLGFVEKCSRKILLTSLFNPSKIGGKPAWLLWSFLPSTESLKCLNCGTQMLFLCQIYVPTEFNNTPIHRTLFVFCCRNGPCSKSQGFIKVFRSQTAEKETDFVSESLTDDELNIKLQSKVGSQTLCNLCGCFGNKGCSLCHRVFYCCKEHQVMDWKDSHKLCCKEKQPNVTKESSFLFTEHEIVIEAEPLIENSNVLNNLIEDQKYKEYLSRNKDVPLDKQLEKDLNKLTEKKSDEYYMMFRDRISVDPEQVLRYDLGGIPLWVSSENIPQEKDIPNCTCGGKRIFEFQILPQMLNYIGVETTVDSLDWGTLCIYTCRDNCWDASSYKEEFVWKQDFSSEDVLS